MFTIEPVVYTPSEPQYAMARNLITVIESRSRQIAAVPAIYLLARSPLSPVSKMIWTNLDYFAGRGIDIFAIFYKRQNAASARNAVKNYRAAFGDKALTNLKLADFVEVGSLYEELQIGSSIAWSGAQLNAEPAELQKRDLNESVSAGDLAMFKATFGKIWRAADSFAEAAGEAPLASRAASGQRRFAV
jgi:hypothetical protein